MKATLAVLICIMLPLIPQLVIYFLTKDEVQEDEKFEFDYR